MSAKYGLIRPSHLILPYFKIKRYFSFIPGVFIDPDSRKFPIERVPRSMFVAMVAFVFWTIVDVTFTYALFNSVLFQFWVIYHSLLFIFVTRYFGGFQNIQYQLLNRFKL